MVAVPPEAGDAENFNLLVLGGELVSSRSVWSAEDELKTNGRGGCSSSNATVAGGGGNSMAPPNPNPSSKLSNMLKRSSPGVAKLQLVSL